MKYSDWDLFLMFLCIVYSNATLSEHHAQFASPMHWLHFVKLVHASTAISKLKDRRMLGGMLNIHSALTSHCIVLLTLARKRKRLCVHYGAHQVSAT